MSDTSSNLTERARSYLQIDCDQLQRVTQNLDDSLHGAVECLGATTGKIVCTGMGKSYHIATKVAATLVSTGTPATSLHPTEALHGDLGILQDGDSVLVLSYSGSSSEILQLLPLMRRREVRIVSVCGIPDAPLASLTDHNLIVNIEREACPFNLAPTTSALVTLAVCDVLAMLIQEERGFTREEYSQLHPAGAIGATLSLRIGDVMRTGERLAQCTPDTCLQDAIVTMTGCRSGCAVITNEDGTVSGIFTDGDLRRAFAAGLAPDTTIGTLMTTNPTTIGRTEKIDAALRVFQTKAIDDLIVTNPDGTLAGMVDLQDLPKLKLFDPGQEAPPTA